MVSCSLKLPCIKGSVISLEGKKESGEYLAFSYGSRVIYLFGFAVCIQVASRINPSLLSCLKPCLCSEMYIWFGKLKGLTGRQIN